MRRLGVRGTDVGRPRRRALVLFGGVIALASCAGTSVQWTRGNHSAHASHARRAGICRHGGRSEEGGASRRRHAHRGGRGHLLIPSVLEWREGARADGEGDRVQISLRLVRIEPSPPPSAFIPTPEGRLPAALITLQGDLVYRARASGVAAAFSRTNESTGRLLDHRFREAVLQLLAGRAR